jgi:hypothetical protein
VVRTEALIELVSGCAMIVAGVSLAVWHRAFAAWERGHRAWLAEHPWALSRTYYVVGVVALLGLAALFARGGWAGAPLLAVPALFILGNRWIVRLQLRMWRFFPEPPAGALIPVALWCVFVGVVGCLGAVQHLK